MSTPTATIPNTSPNTQCQRSAGGCHSSPPMKRSSKMQRCRSRRRLRGQATLRSSPTSHESNKGNLEGGGDAKSCGSIRPSTPPWPPSWERSSSTSWTVAFRSDTSSGGSSTATQCSSLIGRCRTWRPSSPPTTGGCWRRCLATYPTNCLATRTAIAEGGQTTAPWTAPGASTPRSTVVDLLLPGWLRVEIEGRGEGVRRQVENPAAAHHLQPHQQLMSALLVWEVHHHVPTGDGHLEPEGRVLHSLHAQTKALNRIFFYHSIISIIK